MLHLNSWITFDGKTCCKRKRLEIAKISSYSLLRMKFGITLVYGSVVGMRRYAFESGSCTG